MEMWRALDESLFRTINGGLIHPWLDAVMPWSSGNRWFLPLLAVGMVGWSAWGGVRGRVAVGVLCSAVWVNQVAVMGPLKEWIGRARPFTELAEVRLLIAPVETGGMPSAHAAAWCVAMAVAWRFFGKAWLGVLPVAAAVCYSRVYNGVHYPSDVLAGMAEGWCFGWGWVAAWDRVWTRVGPTWFPRGWAAWPSLTGRRGSAAGGGGGDAIGR